MPLAGHSRLALLTVLVARLMQVAQVLLPLLIRR
jgi:hypothetical protein